MQGPNYGLTRFTFCAIVVIYYKSIHILFSVSQEVYIYFVILFYFILFIFGCVGSSLLHVGFLQLRRAGVTLRCGARASHCSGFSHCGARALGARASVVAAHGLSIVTHGLQSTGSVVVAHKLSCSTACGIFLDQGSNSCPLHWQVDSQPLRHQGSPTYIF